MIYGSGAIGSFVGYILSDKSSITVENVALLGRMGHIQKIRNSGLSVGIGDKKRNITFKYCFSSLEELKGSSFVPDVTIVCVKTYSLPTLRDEIIAQDALNGCLKKSIFILLMNGMGNLESFCSTSSPSPEVYQGITSIGVTFPNPGKVILKGKGPTIFEDLVPNDVKSFLEERFKDAGFGLEFSAQFQLHQWEKLLVNSVINPITALTRKSNGIVGSKALKTITEGLVNEWLCIARKEGIDMDFTKACELVYDVSTMTSENTSSMLQDVLSDRRTEIDNINGYLVGMAEKHGLQVPTNYTLYSLIKSIEPKSVEPLVKL